MKANKFTILSIVVLVTSLAAALLPQAAASAQGDERGYDFISAISPHGTRLTQRPDYIWEAIDGATVYQLQVWRGSTRLLNEFPTSVVCNEYRCLKNPKLVLNYKLYKWRVRAKVGGVWGNWSDYRDFNISPPTFDSQFNGTIQGWARKSGGEWINKDSKYLYTTGQLARWTSAYRPVGEYSDFFYQARIYCSTLDNTYLAVHMGSSINPVWKTWYPGYLFGYNNSGKYAIFKYNADGSKETIVPWTATDAIVKYGFNILTVESRYEEAEGHYYTFYINGKIVGGPAVDWSVGYIGITGYRSVDSTDYRLYVDWAKLEVIPSNQ